MINAFICSIGLKFTQPKTIQVNQLMVLLCSYSQDSNNTQTCVLKTLTTDLESNTDKYKSRRPNEIGRRTDLHVYAP